MSLLQQAIDVIDAMDAAGEVVTIAELCQRTGCIDSTASRAIAQRPEVRLGATAWIPPSAFTEQSANRAMDEGAGDVATDGYDLRCRSRMTIRWIGVVWHDGWVATFDARYVRVNARAGVQAVYAADWGSLVNKLRVRLATEVRDD